jgi:hypothetical protein
VWHRPVCPQFRGWTQGRTNGRITASAKQQNVASSLYFQRKNNVVFPDVNPDVFWNVRIFTGLLLPWSKPQPGGSTHFVPRFFNI